MLIYYVVFPCQFFSTCLHHLFINILCISTTAVMRLVKLFFIPSPRHLSTILLYIYKTSRHVTSHITPNKIDQNNRFTYVKKISSTII